MPEAGVTPHPWHPIFVHFPIACWVVGVAVETLYYALPTVGLPFGIASGAFAVALLWLGNATAVVAMVAGVVDLAKLPENPRVIATVYKHVAWMGSAWVLMFGAALFRSLDQGWQQPSDLLILAAELAAVICLIAGGLQASHLVYRLHLGKFEQGP